jgi:hypothetical protein
MEEAAMRKNEVTRAAILTATAFVAAITMGEAIATADTRVPIYADPPSLVPGDAWTIRYSDGSRGTRKFLREEAGVLVFEVLQTRRDGSTSQGLLHLTRDLSTVRMLGAGGTELRRFEPHSLGLQFPLTAGKTWVEKCQRFDEGRLVGTYVGTFKVVGVEAVVGPAGTFQAFRVVGETYEPQDPARRWRFTHWYAPEVGMEAKLQAVEPDGSGTQVELVEFRPAGYTRPPVSFSVPDAFLGVWEGYWREMILAMRLTVEKIEGDTASVIYWRGAYVFPGLQRPSQQRVEGRFLDEKTLQLEIWDDAGRRWAEVTYTLNPDGTLTGRWISGGGVAHATLKKEE